MTTLLIMTTGRSDVQLVVDGVRRDLISECCGELHDELAKREFTIVDAPTDKGRPLDALPEGELSVCTPKLDAVLRFFDASLPTTAIVFETRRTLTSDPRIAGAVLERRLAERVVTVRRHAFLQDEERLEDALNDEDAVIRRSVVDGLSKVIAHVVEETKPDRIFVATTGGLPAANDVIEELVRLHAVGRAQVTSLEVPDGAFAAHNDRAVEEKFHPAAGCRARWHALSLIEKGNLLGAWGAVSHLENEPGQIWTQVVKWLAQFASSLPFDPPLPTDCNLDVLSHQRMAVRAALRVELALRAGDIPRAVHGTVAFFEAALWDKLGERIERSSDPKKRRFFQVKSGDTPTGDKLLRKDDGSDEDRKRPFELKETVDGVDWYWVYDSDGGPAARLAKYFLQCDALMKFDKALGSTIRELRNDIAHNEPTPDLMNEARTRMQNAQLWSNTDTFLSQPLVKDVLVELGEQHPDQICVNLVSTVRARLRAVD